MRMRRARVEDLPAIMDLERVCFGPWRWTEDFMREMMAERAVHTMVVDDDGLVAYAMMHMYQHHRMAELLSLAVSPQRRRQGIGGCLVSCMEREVAERGAGVVMLCVRPENQDAVNLYLSHGYRVLARCQGYYEDGSDADIMVKQLGEGE